MAKISARGDREVARWRRAETGAELVLTYHGRLLHKWAPGEVFTLVGRPAEAEAFAERYAAARDMVRV